MVNTIVTVVSQPAQPASVTIEVPFACPRGKWCTAGTIVNCSLGFYNPHEDNDTAVACIRCPVYSSTLDEGATSHAHCLCDIGFFDNSSASADEPPDCSPCSVGVSCLDRGTTLSSLRIKPGYWRPSASSLDVRRCPDAAANCSATGEAVCIESTSGCLGGTDNRTYCAPDLGGALCQLCEGERVYYVSAGSDRVATCEPCGDLASRTIAICLAVAAGLIVALVVLSKLARMCPSHVETFKRYVAATTPETKLKILVGFCA